MPSCGKRLTALLAAAALAAGCGKAAPPPPAPFANAGSPGRGTIALATKNTTRLGGADPATDAAAVARAVYPGLTAATRPQVVVVVDDRRWGAALAASALAGVPLGAPLLYANGDRLPQATLQALRSMRPLGSAALGGAQVLRVGTAAPIASAAASRLREGRIGRPPYRPPPPLRRARPIACGQPRASSSTHSGPCFRDIWGNSPGCTAGVRDLC